MFTLCFLIIQMIFFVVMFYFSLLIIRCKTSEEYDSSLLIPPGLSVYPLNSYRERVIWLTTKNYPKYIEKVDNLLRNYVPGNCTNGLQFCGETLKGLGPCGVKPYGYVDKDDEPFCVYILVNPVFNWVPQFYKNSLHLPTIMPSSLRRQIQNIMATNEGSPTYNLWLSCGGQRAVDKDNIDIIEFYPKPGYGSISFPFKMGSASVPIIGVRFYGVQPCILVTVRCQIHAQNIPYTYHTYFQIFVDRH